MAIDMSQYKELFLETARKIVSDYAAIQSAPDTEHTTQDIRLMFHSLKGEAMVMGYRDMAMLSFQIETLCKTLLDNETTLDKALKDLLPLPEVFNNNLDTIEKTNREVPLVKEIESMQKLMEGLKRKPLNVLLIEDDSFFQHIFIDKLREKYILVDLSENGEDAIARLASKNTIVYFLILLFQKENNIIPQTPIIAISTLGQEDDVKKALEMGVVDYIKKNEFDFNLLVSRIESIIQKKQDTITFSS